MANVSLPPELWRLVFRQATFHPEWSETEWDHTSDDQIWDCWRFSNPRKYLLQNMATKRTIVQVCSQWWEVGAEFFYECVVISTSAQLDTLVKTLAVMPLDHSLAHGYGWWIKRISCDTKLLSSNHYPQLAALLERCYHLEIFTTMDTADIDVFVQVRLAQLLQSRFHHSLRRVELYLREREPDEGADPPQVLPDLPLTTLGIAFYSNILNVTLHPSFNSITTLIIKFYDYLHDFISEWVFPSLQNLGIQSLAAGNGYVLTDFATRHQQTLVHLYFNGGDEWVLKGLIGCLPYLRSITLSGVVLEDLPLLYREYEHPGLTHLGIVIVSYTDIYSVQEGLRHIVKGGCFPALKVFRLLDESTSVISISAWRDLIEDCRNYGIRFEDRFGKLITCARWMSERKNVLVARSRRGRFNCTELAPGSK